jgi:DNA-binding CsgD family transcriptional regulator
MEGTVSENDARAMIRLVAEVVALNADHAMAKRQLMDGLSRLIGADCWAWMLAYIHPERPPVHVSIQHGGYSEERFAKYLVAIEHPDMQMLLAPLAEEMLARQAHLTRLRQQIDPEERFLRSGAYPFWLEADVAPLIISVRPVNGQCLSAIGIYRRADAPLFTDRERRIAHIILTEVPWLHELGWPEDLGAKAPALSRKRRLVLNLLLEGHDRKTVADQLSLSPHTVSDYVKDIYKTFGVNSRAELMHRFRVGDNGDS